MIKKLVCLGMLAIMREIDTTGTHKMTQNAESVMDTVTSDTPDVIFLNIEMPEINGIDLARMISKKFPDMNIIFITGYCDYALEAHRVYCSSFLEKPVSVDSVRDALAHLRYPIANEAQTQRKLRVVTFGNFEVYTDDGKTLKFSRSLSREIFAYLIDQCGYPVTSKMIALDVLEVQDFDDTTSKKLSKAIGYLVSDLSSAGFTDMIDKQNRQIRINKKQISCDIYDALDGDRSALSEYSGEYMIEYSWSETSYAVGLLRDMLKKIN